LPQLSPKTITLLDGEIRLFRRAHSQAFQAAFKIGDRWVRKSTGTKDLGKAKKRAVDLLYEYRARHKTGMPIVTKRFSDVAAYCVAEMDRLTAEGAGKRSFRDYKIVIDQYLVPYFGSRSIANVKQTDLEDFAIWRAKLLGRDPSASTLSTHNSALNRIFDEAVSRGYVEKRQIPDLTNKGKKSERRLDFRIEEYRTFIRKLPAWIEAGRKGKSREMRHLLRDYILILANTGIRPGTETDSLMWRHVHLFTENGQQFLELRVDGKTGPRDLICRANTINFLKRIHERTKDIVHLSFDELLDAKIDKPVFRLPNGAVTKNLRQTFKILMDDTGLLTCPSTGLNRTLYSFRHTYATFALLNDGMSIHTLAVQMGTSIQMIERHYSHLQPRLQKEVLTGKRHDPDQDEAATMATVASKAISADNLKNRVGNTAIDEPDELDALIKADEAAEHSQLRFRGRISTTLAHLNQRHLRSIKPSTCLTQANSPRPVYWQRSDQAALLTNAASNTS